MAKISFYKAEQARLRITKEQEKEIANLYKQVYKDYKKQMDALPLKGEGTVSQSIQKTYLNKLTKQLKEAYQSMGESLESQIEKGMLDAAGAVVKDNDTWLKGAGISIKGAYSYVPQDIVSRLSTGKVYGEGWTLSKSIWGQEQKTLHDIDQVIAMGVAGNKSAYEIAKDLEKYVDPSAKKEWNWSKVYPGTSKKVDYNAQRLARTMVSHSYQQSLVATTRHNPFVHGYKWRSAHTSRTCEICNERDGKVYSADDLPLDHPNGLCTFLVEMDSLENMADRLADWALGGEDGELDDWADSMFPEAKLKSDSSMGEWLKKAGFSKDHMPENFPDFWMGLNDKDTKELYKMLGIKPEDGPVKSVKMVKNWYNSNMLSSSPSKKVKDSIIKSQGIKDPIIKPRKTKESGTSTFKDWISKMRKNTESKMLDWESRGLRKLPRSQLEALRMYTGSSYEEMNKYLRYVGSGMSKEEAIRRSGISSSQLQAIKNSMKGLDSLKTKESLFLRRGTDLGDLAGLLLGNFQKNKDKLSKMSVEELNKELSGVVGTYNGFTSTSSLWDRGFGGDVEIIFHAPPGTSASSIMSISQFGTGEGETLLNAGTTVRIASIEKSDGHRYSKIRVFMEIIP